MVMGQPKFMGIAALLAAMSFFAASPLALAEENGDGEEEEITQRATLQERFAPKDGRFYAHAGATAIIRDDFYHSPGYGLDAGYYFNENWGVEIRAYNLHSRLAHAGERLRDEQSFVPDLRAPDAIFGLGMRGSWGYGKVLTGERFVVHFDPQWIFHGGITLAEERVVPTLSTGIGFLTHWQYGIQVKLDLQINLHFENRERGFIPATGFIPVFAIGWSPPAGGSQ